MELTEQIVFQGLGGAFLVSAAQSAFVNQMANYVMGHATDVSKATLILTGATNIRESFTVEQQPIVIEGYMTGVKVVFGICIAATGVATLIGLMSPWKKLKQSSGGGGMA